MAVWPSPGAIDALRRALPSSAPLTRTAKWHVTLRFLGEVAKPAAVADALAGAHTPGPFTLRLTGGGSFGAAAWAGVAGDLDRLHDLHTGVRDALAAAGFPADDRPFTPHLTVSYRGDAAVRRSLDDHAGPPWTVTGFSLVRSRAGDYDELAAWPV